MVRSRAVYEDVLWLEPIYSDDRLTAYAVAGRDVLLVFRKGATGQTVTLASGSIHGHGGDGALRSSVLGAGLWRRIYFWLGGPPSE